MNMNVSRSTRRSIYLRLFLTTVFYSISILSASTAFGSTKPQPVAVVNNLDSLSETSNSSLKMDSLSAYPTHEITLDLLLGKVSPEGHPLFVEVCPSVSNEPGKFMHRDAYSAFLKMHEAAAADGVNLVIVSAMRSFNQQKRIWNDKWNGRVELADNVNASTIQDPFERALEILRFSAMPGTSRHHWGTDIDLNSVEPAFFQIPNGQTIYAWLKNNAARFGFCQPYSPKGDSRWGGYEEEPWHWSYKPVSALYLKAFGEIVSYDHIRGFHGWENAWELRIIRNFVMNVNRDCRLQIGD